MIADWSWSAPAEEALQWESRKISVEINGTRSIYAEPPNEKSDEAWSALFKRRSSDICL